MKKIVLIYGLIAGLLTCTGFLVMGEDMNLDKSMIYGFTAMIVAFSLIFVATAQYRKQNGGILSFKNAFLIGLYISLIASTVYVGVWLITYYNLYPDFMEKYSARVISDFKADGATAAQLQEKIVKVNKIKEYYKNPLYIIATTYMEILPLSLVVSLISAVVLKRKPKVT